jgi:hypothetical protein
LSVLEPEGKGGIAGAVEEDAGAVLPLDGKGGKAGAEPLEGAAAAWVEPGISGKGGISWARTHPAKVINNVTAKNRLNIPFSLPQ